MAALTYGEVVDVLEESLSTAAGPPARVYTPNIQHIGLLRTHPEFRQAYERADLLVPDGWPVAAVVGLRRRAWQRRVTGADLLWHLCRRAAVQGWRVGLLGGSTGAAAGAAARLQMEIPGLRMVLVEPAPEGFLHDHQQLYAILSSVAAARLDVLFVGLGTPKGELFIDSCAGASGARVAISIGAGLDFASGSKPRAPRLVRGMGLEWLYRVYREPRRLVARYALAAPLFLWEVVRWSHRCD